MIDTSCKECMKQAAKIFATLNLQYQNLSVFNVDALAAFINGLYTEYEQSIQCSHTKISVQEEKLVPLTTKTFPLLSSDADRKIVSIFGSVSKAHSELTVAEVALTMAGFIVFKNAIDLDSTFSQSMMYRYNVSKPNVKLLAYDKIILSDAVWIINSAFGQDNDYLGEETANIVSFARSVKKEIWWLHQHSCKETCKCKVTL